MVSSLSSRILFAGFVVVLWSGNPYANGCYPSIISFGDSIADTGNLNHLSSVSDDVQFPCIPPYGQDFIPQSTGRCSNGRLIIDFLAQSLGLPLIPSYFNIKRNTTFRHGVNFAVGGATALDASVINAISSDRPVINASLEIQLSWFKQSLPSICGKISDCRNFIGRSLILMGEIGGNDYNHQLFAGKSIEEIEPYVPLVTDTIVSVINELINMGARTLVVPGNFPIGCFPSSLTTRKEKYDPITGCRTKLNVFVKYHNKMLQSKLNQIREHNPAVKIIYADYYNVVMQIYRFPEKYGFTRIGTSKACCGCGGLFNYNTSALCGDLCKISCDDPDTYISWDGMHLTEGAYKVIAKKLFQGSYTKPEFSSLCPTSVSLTGYDSI